jgi:hypothetical protein
MLTCPPTEKHQAGAWFSQVFRLGSPLAGADPVNTARWDKTHRPLKTGRFSVPKSKHQESLGIFMLAIGAFFFGLFSSIISERSNAIRSARAGGVRAGCATGFAG